MSAFTYEEKLQAQEMGRKAAREGQPRIPGPFQDVMMRTFWIVGWDEAKSEIHDRPLLEQATNPALERELAREELIRNLLKGA